MKAIASLPDDVRLLRAMRQEGPIVLTFSTRALAGVLGTDTAEARRTLLRLEKQGRVTCTRGKGAGHSCRWRLA